MAKPFRLSNLRFPARQDAVSWLPWYTTGVKYKTTFLPARANDYTPHLLQKTAMVFMCGLILLSFIAVNIQTLLWLSSDWLVGAVLPAVVVDKTNEERSTLDELPLTRSPLLDEAARLKAEDMAKGSYFSHYSPTGVSPWHWFEVVDYQYAHAGENLAVHFTDSAAVVEAWMNSPSHRANIVNGAYTEIGVGTAKGTYQGFDTVFVVQLFGTPAAPLQPAAPVPVAPPTLAEATPVQESTQAPAAPTVVLGEATDEPAPVLDGADTAAPAPEVALPPAPDVVLPQPDALSSFMATSSGLEPDLASTKSLLQAHQSGTTPAESFITMPNHVLRIIYLFLGALIAVLLLISILLGMRYHRPWQVVYGVGLLLLMSGLFYFHTMITATVVIAAPLEQAQSHE